MRISSTLLADIQKNISSFEIFVQDDPALFPDLVVHEDKDLELSFKHKIEIVPTILKMEKNSETERIIGWNKERMGRNLSIFRRKLQITNQQARLRFKIT